MSSPVVVINQNQVKEKKKRGRPRKTIPKIDGADPDEEQKFRIFKTITEPNMLMNAEEKDELVQKLEEIFGNPTMTADYVANAEYTNDIVDNNIHNDEMRQKETSLQNAINKIRYNREKRDADRLASKKALEELINKKGAVSTIGRIAKSRLQRDVGNQMIEEINQENAISTISRNIKAKIDREKGNKIMNDVKNTIKRQEEEVQRKQAADRLQASVRRKLEYTDLNPVIRQSMEKKAITQLTPYMKAQLERVKGSKILKEEIGKNVLAQQRASARGVLDNLQNRAEVNRARVQAVVEDIEDTSNRNKAATTLQSAVRAKLGSDNYSKMLDTLPKSASSGYLRVDKRKFNKGRPKKRFDPLK